MPAREGRSVDVPQVPGVGDVAAAVVLPHVELEGVGLELEAELIGGRCVDIEHRNGDLDLIHRGVELRDQVFVSRHAVFSVANDHRVQSRIADDERFLTGTPGTNDSRQRGGVDRSWASPCTTPVPRSFGMAVPARGPTRATPDTWATFISFATISARLTIGALPPEALLAI